MAESSWGFTTLTNQGGDATGPVPSDVLADHWHAWIAGGDDDAGVNDDVLGALAVTVPAGTSWRVQVADGFALVHGYHYKNDAGKVLITNNVSQTTRRRVVLELSLASGDANFKRIRMRILNGVAGVLSTPNLTQQAAGVWQIPLARFDVDAGGNITNLTDQRVLIGPHVGVPPANDSITEAMLKAKIVSSGKIKDGAVGKDQASDDIMRRYGSTDPNTIRDMTETDFNALSTKDTDTLYTVDE